MKANDLKKELIRMGIDIVKGSYVRKKDVEKLLSSVKPKTMAILDTNTIKQSVQTLKKNKKFNELKKHYEILKEELIGNNLLTPEEASSVINYAIHANTDSITTIDFRQSLDKIKNFKDLPNNVQEAIKSADHIESKGFQELLGYDHNNKIIWSAGGHWDGRENKPTEKFIVENFGGMKCPSCKNVGIQWSNR